MWFLICWNNGSSSEQSVRHCPFSRARAVALLLQENGYHCTAESFYTLLISPGPDFDRPGTFCPVPVSKFRPGYGLDRSLPSLKAQPFLLEGVNTSFSHNSFCFDPASAYSAAQGTETG